MNHFALRKATISDSEFAYQTKKAAFMEYVEMVSGWNEEEQRQLHNKHFESQDFYVITANDINVGILAIVHQADCIKINQIQILPEYQNRGIGTAYITHLIDDAVICNLNIRLQVLKANNRAISFYQRLGFVISGESNTYLIMERQSQ